ncbi:hypothetical protein DS742_20690 [Lacrimispora amygdalina]|uniref:Uncharacterized protein n=1 Tax=Lacrimispora amygdalina TaxID=253257 RepID=A0A3E2N7S3_9FIRM|nr:hypothetical protein [Clostridium indicum]RFZ77053.1 hypothetical protein DS742_20690 [Clostridium indicum]
MKSFQKPTIPTREEFHRFYAGEINVRDFCTERTNQRRIPPYTPEERKVQSDRAQMTDKHTT